MEGHAISEKEEKGLRGKLMGKLRREKKTQNAEDVDDFLHGPSDKLHMMPVTNEPGYQTPLIRIDTNNASRWPTTAEVQSSRAVKRRSASSKRSRKGLVVHFAQANPEIIGEGGDECSSPVSEIGQRKRANSHPATLQPDRSQNSVARRPINSPGPSPRHSQELYEPRKSTEEPSPRPLQRTQIEFEPIPDIQRTPEQILAPGTSERLDEGLQRTLGQRSELDRRSFAEIKADMQSGEGLALVKAASNTSIVDKHLPDATNAVDVLTPQMDELHVNTMKNVNIPLSPGLQQSHSRPLTPNDTRPMEHLTESPSAPKRGPTFTLHEAAVAVGDDALQDFSSRVVHLFTLFRLSAEALKPIPQCTLEELVRAAVWWFLKGRLYLETAVRDRPSTPQSQQRNFFVRQQAFADLAKSLWIIETVTPEFPEIHHRPSLTPGSNTHLADVLDVRQGTMTSLRKLCMSMKRNNFLPPSIDDVPLTQGLDASIWVQDDGNRSLLAIQRQTATFLLSETFPLGDTTQTFLFSRMFVEAVLLEESASQNYRCPVTIALIRGHNQKEITAIVTNQDGSLRLAIQTNKSRGPTWDDVRWQSKHNTVEVKLPRGFALRLHCSEHEYRTIWGIYDYEKKTHASLLPRPGEELVFETVLRTFQHFDQSSRPVFPREPQPHCHLRVFEKTIIEKAATGPRTLHRGFRVGLNTSSTTKNLRGIDQELPPSKPIQFGFLRGDGGFPAFLLKIDDGKSKYTMVSTFEDINERTRLHTLLTGTALGNGEDNVAEAPLKHMSIIGSDASTIGVLQSLEFQSFRIINQDYGSVEASTTILSENLRVVLSSKSGTLTDRINVSPGELKLRLEVQNTNILKILRQPQQDLTISVSESQVPKTLPSELALLLQDLATSDSTRIYTFPSTKELHLFQSALTGFSVLFDGLCESFSISRRRMVVPIYKKWDAENTRLQVVQKEKTVQLLAFFEDFSHGDCMNFTLKSTDVFESFGKGGKYGLRIVDAKFAMPKAPREGTEHQFVCLDMPDYPGEHDDIVLVFDDEKNREALMKALPAPVKVASRMSSVRR